MEMGNIRISILNDGDALIHMKREPTHQQDQVIADIINTNPEYITLELEGGSEGRYYEHYGMGEFDYILQDIEDYYTYGYPQRSEYTKYSEKEINMLNKIDSLIHEVNPKISNQVQQKFGLDPLKPSYDIGTPIKYGGEQFTVNRVYDYKEAQKKYPDLKRQTTSIEPIQVIVIGNENKVHGIVIGKSKNEDRLTYVVFYIPLLL